MRPFVPLVLALTLAGVSPPPALAMSGECFWSRLQPSTRNALVDGYQRQGPGVLDQTVVSDRELDAIDAGCEAAGADGELKDRLLAAVTIEHGAAVYLERRLGWDDEALQEAWERMAPHDMAALRRGADAILKKEQPADDLVGPLRAFLGRDPAGEDPGVADQAMGYLTSRALREAIERRG